MTLEKLLGISLPIIQAPMAGVQGSDLAVAVSEAGGLGSLPCGMLTPAALQSELTLVTEQTDKPYNVNFFCHQQPQYDAGQDRIWRTALAPYYAELGIDPETIATGPPRVPFDAEAAKLLEDFKPPVVSFHFGLPSAKLLAKVQSWGAKVLSTATTVEEALWLEDYGADAIIAQGFEAGGHRGMFLSQDIGTQLDTLNLVAQIVAAVNIPVIAAGGIGDAKGVASVMAHGAAGAQIGTAYLLCPEANTSSVHRAALKSSGANETAITNLFSGRPARGIVNRLMRDIGPISAAAPTFPLAAAVIGPLRAKAESAGKGDFSPLWAGKNTAACREVSAAVLTRKFAERL